MDRWVPAFGDALEAKIFALGHLKGLLSASGGEGVEVIEVLPPSAAGARTQAPSSRRIAPPDREVRLQVGATFRRWADLLEAVRRIEEAPPLFVVEALECRKEGRAVHLSLMLRFPFRREDEG